jgi:hypothetical protein
MVDKRQHRLALGGEFALSMASAHNTPPTQINFPPKTIYFQSGRDAIRALLTIFPKRKILASSYSCETVVNALRFPSFDNLKLLAIDESMYPDIELIGDLLFACKGDYSDTLFFLGNLWGTKYPPDLVSFLKSFRGGGGIVIEDITHKLDQKPIIETDGWICSVRKWFGSSGLAALNLYAHSFDDNQECLRVASSVSERLILMQVLNYFPKQSRLRRQIIENLRNSDAKLGSGNRITLASHNEIKRFESQDWQQIFAARLSNKKIYEDQIKQNSTMQILNPSRIGTNSFPTTIKLSSGQQDLRTFLRSKNIFAANLWPLGEWGTADPRAAKLSQLTLTLPSDQRFDSESCVRIAEVINCYQAKNI